MPLRRANYSVSPQIGLRYLIKDRRLAPPPLLHTDCTIHSPVRQNPLIYWVRYIAALFWRRRDAAAFFELPFAAAWTLFIASDLRHFTPDSGRSIDTAIGLPEPV